MHTGDPNKSNVKYPNGWTPVYENWKRFGDGKGGNMQIGNIHWKQIRLETSFQIGNNLFRLETKKVHWKQSFQIGNKKSTLETIFLDWKQNKYIGNNHFRLET